MGKSQSAAPLIEAPLRLAGAESVPLLGRVAWCAEREGQVEAGFEFVDLTAVDRVWLREWVEELQQA